MKMTIQLTASELSEILAEHLDQTVLQHTVNPDNITRLSATCEPDGELEALQVYLDFSDDESDQS